MSAFTRIEKSIVGSAEWCSMPQIGIPAIKARIDSGAKTSAIHAFNIHTFMRNNEKWVSFELHPIQRDRSVVVRCESRVFDRRAVKSSSGVSEKRYVIKQTLVLGHMEWEIEVTLTNRDSMGFRMLLGREAMIDRVLIDPSESCRLGELSSDVLHRLYNRENTRKSGLRIALLASNADLYSNQRIMEAGEERGHEMIFLNIKQCYMKLDALKPEIHYRGGNIVENIDAVIPRIRPSLTFYGCALIRHFQALRIFSLNSSASITQSRDKLFALQLLQANGLSIPVSGFANSPVETADLIHIVGGAPLVVKLLEGTQGRGVVLAETRQAAESVINAFKSLKANLLVQEFVKEAGGKDLRCFVVDGKVVAAIERRAADGEFRANIHRGGSAHIVKLTAEEKHLSVRAAKCLDLKVAGVDIIRSKKGPLLLEINSSPGLEGIETATGKDIAGCMISSIEKHVGWKRELSSKATSTSDPSDEKSDQ